MVEADYTVELGNDVLRELLEYWTSRRRGDRLPRRGDVDPIAMKAWLPHVMLLDVELDPRRFRWRLIGTHITWALGRDATGKWFDEFYEPVVCGGMTTAYSQSVERRAPVRFTGRADFARKSHVGFESLHMPLVDDDDRVTMLLAGAVIPIEDIRRQY